VQEGTFEQGTSQQPTIQTPAPSASEAQKPANPAPADTSDDNSKRAPRNTPQLKLGIGDLVEVNVYGVPELTTKTRVSSSGDLYLPLVNYIHVADLTIEEAQQLIEKRLAEGGFVRDPHVSLLIDEFSSQGVSMLGEIAKPGIYPVLGDRRLVDLITAAGGLTDRAGREVTITHRDQPDKPEIVTLDRTLTANPDSNVPIFPGDSVEVHRAPIIYVVGDVGRPSGLLVDNGTLTVLQALALAGGANHTAKLNDSRILRKSTGPNGITETKVQLKKMLEAKSPDIPLQANDILFVPLSGAKVAAARSFEAAVAITTGLAIYAAHP
jgi:polysaccharide export outer membrane protein